jgi:hypothetical protein
MKASFTLASGAKGDIRFGVWGECVYGVDPTQLGFTGVNFYGACTHKGLGLTTRTVYVSLKLRIVPIFFEAWDPSSEWLLSRMLDASYDA